MDINIALHVEKIKALPRPLKIVAAVILFDFLLVGFSWLLLSDLLDERSSEIQQTRSQAALLRKQNSDLRKQIDQYPVFLARYNDALGKGIMTEIDRLKVVSEAQDLAVRHHLVDLHFKVEGELQKIETNSHFQLDNTIITFDSGALLDQQVLAFWDEVLGRLPTHYQVQELTLERRRDPDGNAQADIRAGRPVSTLGMKISFKTQALRPIAAEGQ
ncbi:MAG TPA: hypothetical protein HPP80_08400 [Rhodospirillaceae bacterium]|nr:hypothetical protein [Rhodospirillaceae bacterium]